MTKSLGNYEIHGASRHFTFNEGSIRFSANGLDKQAWAMGNLDCLETENLYIIMKAYYDKRDSE
jgi:hypothetical protein